MASAAKATDWNDLGGPSSLEQGCFNKSKAMPRDLRPTGEGVKNLESPSISPLVFLLTVSVAGVVEVGVRGGVVEGVEVVNWVASPAQQGSATANLSLASFTDAA